MIQKAKKRLPIGLVALLFLGEAIAQDVPFYRGGLDHKKVESANGAILNADHHQRVLLAAQGANVVQVNDRVHTITGLSISNYSFVEGENGLIAFDTGNNIGMGQSAIEMIRRVTDKPVIAIIYSHHHYTGGASAYLEGRNRDEIEIYAHPDVEQNLLSTISSLGPMQVRRTGTQFGFYLPHEGPDAMPMIAEPTFKDPALRANGHLPVTYNVADGESVEIDGLKVVFHHIQSDTADSLAVHIPSLDLVLHNSMIAPSLFPMYTLRGDYHRDPVGLIAGVDKIRAIRPQYLVGAHGPPLTDREQAYNVATAHRDAASFTYNQAIRAINQGKTPDDMVAEIKLPRHLAAHPWLFPGYVDHEYNLRAQYRGLVGWFAEDSADLHPPRPEELGAVMIEGFGGEDKIVRRAQQAFDEKKYNLTAKLLSFVLASNPGNRDAAQLKADALRAMAQTTPSLQTRNFMLTHARDLEEKIDRMAPLSAAFFGEVDTKSLLATPPGTTIRLLETKLDATTCRGVRSAVAIRFSDLDMSWNILLRPGVAEVVRSGGELVNATLSIDRKDWVEMVLRIEDLNLLLSTGKASIDGDAEVAKRTLHCFD